MKDIAYLARKLLDHSGVRQILLTVAEILPSVRLRSVDLSIAQHYLSPARHHGRIVITVFDWTLYPTQVWTILFNSLTRSSHQMIL